MRRLAGMILAVAAAGSFLSGCSREIPMGSAPVVSFTPPPEVAHPTDSETFSTAMLPMAAAKAAENVFNDFQFASEGHLNFSSQPMANDYFNADVGGTGGADDQIDVRCKWIKEGETEVTVRSNLPEGEFHLVVNRLRTAMGGATSRPVFEP